MPHMFFTRTPHRHSRLQNWPWKCKAIQNFTLKAFKIWKVGRGRITAIYHHDEGLGGQADFWLRAWETWKRKSRIDWGRINIGEGRAKGLKACLKPSIFNVYSILWRAVLNLFHYTVTYRTYFIQKTSLVNKKLKMWSLFTKTGKHILNIFFKNKMQLYRQ